MEDYDNGDEDEVNALKEIVDMEELESKSQNLDSDDSEADDIRVKI